MEDINNNEGVLEVPSVKEQLNEIENVDETVLAEFVSSKIKYEFAKSFLVKQLEPTMVEKEIDIPVPNGEFDEDGNELTDMKKETTKIVSVLRVGVVLKVPTSLQKIGDETYKIGDKVVYRNLRATDFDLVPGSALVDPFDVICKEV